MSLDHDLASIQEVRELLIAAKAAQLEFRSYSQEQVDRIVHAMVEAGYAEAARLGRLASEETGFGKPEDKKLKNEFATRRVWESIKDLKTVGVIGEVKEKKLILIGEPMGVVAALIPSTNPTSTVMFKAIISVKARNAIVASPHPRAARCTIEAMNVVRDAAEKAGAPKHLLAILTNPTIEGTTELMKHKLTAVILATGSNPMVKSAYSSGKPAYGVGSGNVPAFIERTANVVKAVADIISGKQFDYGVLCSTESALVCDAPVKAQVMEECRRKGAYFAAGDEKTRLARLMFDERGALNPDMVGKPPAYIAQKAGFMVPQGTTVLIAEEQGVGRQYPLSREKLSPVLSFYTEDGWREACHRCIELLEFGGVGHTLVIHSSDQDIIMKFALEKPAFRILVNTQAALGAVGYTNGLDPSMTLGPGTWGGSIVSDNVTARHLMNVKRLAFETHPINPATPSAVASPVTHATPAVSPKSGSSWMEEIDKRILLKAGNPPVWKKDESKPENPKTGEAPGSGTFGTGISADDVDKIVAGFIRDLTCNIPMAAPRKESLRLVKLPRRFYLRSAIAVARDLLGTHLVTRSAGQILIGRIVEVEAYLGDRDPASHAYRGMTPRNEVMFGDGGHLYVYFTYGMHHCCNVVTGPAGEASAVLLRAVEPVRGRSLMRKRREGGKSGRVTDASLTNGPGKLCQAFGITRELNGADLCGERIWIGKTPGPRRRTKVARSPRVGISQGQHHLWRFILVPPTAKQQGR